MSSILEGVPLHEGVRVLAEHPRGLAALAKPEGLLAHPNRSEDNARSLVTANYSLEDEAYHVRDGAGGIRRLWLVNRLDGPTSGVILVATRPEAADAARREFAHGRVLKRYAAVCLARGLLAGQRGTWNDLLARQGGGDEGVRVAALPPGVPPRGPVAQALTLFQVGQVGRAGLALLRLEPRTGRTHQLRVQCASRGHPILGDRTYGDFEANRALGAERGFRRLFLHAESLEISVDLGGERVRFVARDPAPPEFAAALGEPPPPRGAAGLGRVRV